MILTLDIHWLVSATCTVSPAHANNLRILRIPQMVGIPTVYMSDTTLLDQTNTLAADPEDTK